MNSNNQCFAGVFFFFFHCQILNGALYLDWDDFHMQSIFKNEMELKEQPT